MSMDIEEYRKRKAFAGELKPSMTRRNPYNDYEGRQMYMITMVTEGRLPLFGNVTGNPLLPVDNPDGPHIELSPLGKAVAQCWCRLQYQKARKSLCEQPLKQVCQ
jgi:hypothetical protein